MKRIFLAAIIITVALIATAEVVFIQNGLKYTTLDESSVRVDKIDENHKPEGKLEIPAVVKHDGSTYTVTTIGNWGLFGCNQLTEVKLPSTLKEIGFFAFCRCDGLKRIDIPKSVTEIKDAAFENCNGFTEITIPDGITVIHDRLMSECRNLKTVNLPQSVTTINMSAFSSCKSLESIVLPQAIETIGNYAFAYCDSLKSVTLPNTLKSIGSEAFSCDISLKSIVIPDSVSSIGNRAFHNCPILEQVTLPAALTSLKGNPFSSCKSLKEYKVSPHNNTFVVADGILFSKDMTKLVACPTSKVLGDYVVPASVKVINPYAFFECRGLTSVKMTNVTTIGESAFYYCTRLANIDFGEKLETLGKAAFYSCGNITSIVIPDSFKHMDMNNFDFCSSLKTVSVSEELFNREKDFNNLSFQFNSDSLRFIVRLPDGTTLTKTPDELPDVKKYFHNR